MAFTEFTRSSRTLLRAFRPMLDHVAEARRRQTLRRDYGAMSCAQLHDIGLTPLDVLIALALPLDCNAGEALAKAAAREAARW